MLNELIIARRDEIIARTRGKVAARSSPRPADVELDKGIPQFLDRLGEALRSSLTQSPRSDAGAAKHGGDLLRMGFTVSQVVHGYGDVCQAVTELALETDRSIPTDEFRIFNSCLDNAIASAVTEYERRREDGISRQGTARLGVLAHELRNSLSTAMLAFASMKRGLVGPESSTGALLNRSLLRLRDLIDRSLSEVRLESEVLDLKPVFIGDLIQEVAIVAGVDAAHRGVVFAVEPFVADLVVEADRHLLIGAVENIVQNALKFTPPHGQVVLTVREVEGHVLIDVADACGGLPEDKMHHLFDAFEQRGADRSGLGLGLWISRTSLSKFGGKISARDVPGHGCVFSITLPKLKIENTSPPVDAKGRRTSVFGPEQRRDARGAVDS
jgi:signal transduction histidine kinase